MHLYLYHNIYSGMLLNQVYVRRIDYGNALSIHGLYFMVTVMLCWVLSGSASAVQSISILGYLTMVKAFSSVGENSVHLILVWALELWKLLSEYEASQWWWPYQVWKPTHFRSFGCSLRSSVYEHFSWYRVQTVSRINLKWDVDEYFNYCSPGKRINVYPFVSLECLLQCNISGWFVLFHVLVTLWCPFVFICTRFRTRITKTKLKLKQLSCDPLFIMDVAMVMLVNIIYNLFSILFYSMFLYRWYLSSFSKSILPHFG